MKIKVGTYLILQNEQNNVYIHIFIQRMCLIVTNYLVFQSFKMSHGKIFLVLINLFRHLSILDHRGT